MDDIGSSGYSGVWLATLLSLSVCLAMRLAISLTSNANCSAGLNDDEIGFEMSRLFDAKLQVVDYLEFWHKYKVIRATYWCNNSSRLKTVTSEELALRVNLTD